MERTLIERTDGTTPAQGRPVGPERLREWTRLLLEYKAGKAQLERRVIAAEEWWRLRNTAQEEREGRLEADGAFHSASGWLHNVIVSKHADAMDAYPEPLILPREPGDRAESELLSQVLPAILEENDFEETYSQVLWQKLKTGTGVYQVLWDPRARRGLGEIAVRRVDLLNLFWTPGVSDLQDARAVFHTSAVSREELEEQYPRLRCRRLEGGPLVSRFLTEEQPRDRDRLTLIEVYYRKRGRLHYAKYVGEELLYATENDDAPPLVDGRPVGRPLSVTGLYDHGRYPFVFDCLFPVEGSPCGYGFVDLCRSPQTEIDLLKTAILKNALVGATPRYFLREDGEVNEEELRDLRRPLIHVSGNLGADSLRVMDYRPLDGNYVAHLLNTIEELRETSGNTQTSTGNISSGVTAASAIAALQEASGKGSRDATRTSYRAFSQVVALMIELIRQFYDLPRSFRIVGERGRQRFVAYSNRGLLGAEPVFDIRVGAQKKNAYARLGQNELALQLYKLGFFQPQGREAALMCLDLMDFEGREGLQQALLRGEAASALEARMEALLAPGTETVPETPPENPPEAEKSSPAPASGVGEHSDGEAAALLRGRAVAATAHLPGEQR